MESTKSKSPIKRGRWKTPEEIIEKIGEVTRRISRYRLAGEALNAKFRKLKAEGKESFLWKDADAKMSKADKLEKGYLQRLKRKLAEMQTDLLPMEGNTDKSISK